MSTPPIIMETKNENSVMTWQVETDYQADTNYKISIEKVEDGQANYLRKEPCWLGCDGFERIRAPKQESAQEYPQKGPPMHPAFEVIGFVAVMIAGFAAVMFIIMAIMNTFEIIKKLDMLLARSEKEDGDDSEAAD